MTAMTSMTLPSQWIFARLMAQWAQMFWAPKTLLKTSWETSASVTGIVELASFARPRTLLIQPLPAIPTLVLMRANPRELASACASSQLLRMQSNKFWTCSLGALSVIHLTRNNRDVVKDLSAWMPCLLAEPTSSVMPRAEKQLLNSMIALACALGRPRSWCLQCSPRTAAVFGPTSPPRLKRSALPAAKFLTLQPVTFWGLLTVAYSLRQGKPWSLN
mmetsp:Transcript_26224/g.70911  ORF Transcript_26224/g.70911 Transcript_26224/m.70911 type:complete len:218 (-) Transcript_26224:2482-3135(-)